MGLCLPLQEEWVEKSLRDRARRKICPKQSRAGTAPEACRLWKRNRANAGLRREDRGEARKRARPQRWRRTWRGRGKPRLAHRADRPECRAYVGRREWARFPRLYSLRGDSAAHGWRRRERRIAPAPPRAELAWWAKVRAREQISDLSHPAR